MVCNSFEASRKAQSMGGVTRNVQPSCSIGEDTCKNNTDNSPISDDMTAKDVDT